MKLIVKASIVEDGLIEQVENLAKRNEELFNGEQVVLMPDVHKTNNDPNTNSVPVGFTMTLSKGLIPVDFISADMFCGVTGLLVKDWTPSRGDLIRLNTLARDIIPVNRQFSGERLTDMGTLGGGNHYAEVGIHSGDTLISVHSGSRGFGGNMFKKHKNIAIEHTKEREYERRVAALKEIEPKERQAYLESLPKTSNLPLLDVEKYPQYFEELEETREFAHENRLSILSRVAAVLQIPEDKEIIGVESVHNFLDVSGEVPIVRKGSIAATTGEQVVIPVNMRDGVILGTVTNTEEVNYSLPHGAGRILSRGAAMEELDLAQFKEDMKEIISSTVQAETLDESPRAYKDLDTILEDIEPYLTDVQVFKTVFNYKGI